MRVRRLSDSHSDDVGPLHQLPFDSPAEVGGCCPRPGFSLGPYRWPTEIQWRLPILLPLKPIELAPPSEKTPVFVLGDLGGYCFVCFPVLYFPPAHWPHNLAKQNRSETRQCQGCIWNQARWFPLCLHQRRETSPLRRVLSCLWRRCPQPEFQTL